MSHSPQSISRRDVWRMFNGIAGRYDLLNRLLSLHRDTVWRRHLVRKTPAKDKLTVLDVATGTAEVLLALCRERPGTRGIGVDMAGGMLALGRAKIRRAGLEQRALLVRGDGCRIALPDRSVDAATIAFGVRNFEDLDAGLREMTRVLRPGGRLLVLEFSLPENRVFRAGYLWYLRHIVPQLGAWISGNPRAYTYLNQTIETFPCGEAFCQCLRAAGFADVVATPLTFGIVAVYEACVGGA